jgi:hypothetical protein
MAPTSRYQPAARLLLLAAAASLTQGAAHDASAPANTTACAAQCHLAGHCCPLTPSTSACQHPSCAMGCAMGARATGAAACEAVCRQADGACSFTVPAAPGGAFPALNLRMCDSVGPGQEECHASCNGISDSECGGAKNVAGCILGCRIMFQVRRYLGCLMDVPGGWCSWMCVVQDKVYGRGLVVSWCSGCVVRDIRCAGMIPDGGV